MKRIFSQISSTIRTSGGTGTGNSGSSRPIPPIRASASVSTGGVGTTVSSSIVGQPPPRLSHSTLPLPRSISVPLNNTNTLHSIRINPIKPSISGINYEYEIDSKEARQAERDKRSFYYTQLLNSAMDLLLGSNYPLASDNTREIETLANKKNWLKTELSLKQILSKNKGMKEIILKMANTVANQLEGDESSQMGFIHPFVSTAGEVFFGANGTNEDSLPNYVQDILTPGLLVLLMEKLLNPIASKKGLKIISNNAKLNDELSGDLHGLSKRHLLLAKALVKTSAGYLIHRTIQETNHLEETPLYFALHQGNKLATLTGDLLVISLIKNIASTKSNKVLELTMNSLSEFSTTEVSKFQKSFRQINTFEYESLLPRTLAESEVFSKGFQSTVILSGISDPSIQNWAGELGTLVGLLWKNSYDYGKLQRINNGANGLMIVNLQEFNEYLNDMVLKAENLIKGQEDWIYKDCNNYNAINILIQIIRFWGTKQF